MIFRLRPAWVALSLAIACLSGTPWVQARPLPDALAELAREHRYPLTFSDGRLGGTGGDKLIAEMDATDIVLFGENHGVADIAALALALYRLDGERPRRLVTEVGPDSAREVERMLREGSLRDFLRRGVNLQSLPFFAFAEEMPLLEAAVAAFADGAPALWGIDQEFIAAPPLLLPRLAQLAATPAQRDAVAAARRASRLNPFLFGTGSGAALARLQQAFDDGGSREAKTLAEQLVLSHRIYREQMGGDAAWSNARRETLMMENFLAHAGAGAAATPLFFKFGAFHLYQGRSPTVDEALGQRVADWAQSHGLSTLGLFVDCAGGTMRDGLFGREVACDSFLERYANGLHQLAFDSGWTLVDLRPLRGHPALEEAATWVRHTITGYDFLLLVREPRAATFLPGRLVTHVYGGAVVGVVLVVLTLLVWSLVRFWRRRRRRLAARALAG